MRVWRQALELLPLESEQYRMIYDRMRVLAGAGHMYAGNGQPAESGYGVYGSPARAKDTWATALLKTGGSMIVSILFYAYLMGNLYFAAGFVLLILVHEMGHVLAMRYYRLNASPPIFIPLVGALINLRQQPPNAKVEAIVGIGGPVTGTIGAVVCYILYQLYPQHEMLLILAFFGFFLNLFNMLPVPPLDGGRVTAAVNPRIWMLGIAGLVGLIVANYLKKGEISFIMILVLIYAWPRIRATLRKRGTDSPYYQISKLATRSITAAYILLGAFLLVMYWICSNQAHLSFF
jgi:Zn-dependent protease